MEKYIEDAGQDEKHVADLLGAIMKPPDPVKDELRQKLFKIDQRFRKSKVFPPEANTTFSHSRFSARNGLPYPNKSNIWPR